MVLRTLHYLLSEYVPPHLRDAERASAAERAVAAAQPAPPAPEPRFVPSRGLAGRDAGGSVGASGPTRTFGGAGSGGPRGGAPGGGRSFRGMGNFSSKNELGFHGSTGQNLREEEELFGAKDHVSQGINFDRYDDIPVETSGRDVPEPVEEFTEQLLGPALLRNVDLAKFSRPTPVQKYSIPMGAAGRDIMACAQTGSGKTGGFLFPTIMSLLEKGARSPPGGAPSRLQFPSAVILSPTRELTTQIYEEARRFCYRTGIRPVVVYGGQPFGEQAREVSKGCDLLVATPGRLIDFLDRGRIALDCVQFLVLDEADRMLDMGFEPQIRRIVQDQGMPVDTRQTFMFSATFPNEIQQMATDFMRDYIFLAVGRVGGAAQDITQVVELVEDRDKPMQLMRHLNTVTEGLIVVFVERKASADQLEWELTREGYPATSIHGDRDQWQREEALKSFKDGRTPILVATDVAARGLDINNVGHVFNFDMPNNIDDYVHRIGRTGRAGNTGKAVSFVNARNSAIVGGLIDLLQEAEQEVPNFLPRLMSSRGGGRGGRGGRRGGRGGRGGSNFGARDMRTGVASTVHNVRSGDGGRSGGSSGGARFGAGRRAGGASAW